VIYLRSRSLIAEIKMRRPVFELCFDPSSIIDIKQIYCVSIKVYWKIVFTPSTNYESQ
jgi:hypothetical protein